jgi:hypothetical protein
LASAVISNSIEGGHQLQDVYAKVAAPAMATRSDMNETPRRGGAHEHAARFNGPEHVDGLVALNGPCRRDLA